MTLFLYSCEERSQFLEDYKIKETEEDVLTRASQNNSIRELTGDMNPYVGTRQTYTVKLEKGLMENTRVRIKSSNDAVLIAYGSTYVREHVISVSAYDNSFTFATLITKPSARTSFSISSNGGDFFAEPYIGDITAKMPTIIINGPKEVRPNTEFEISVDHSTVPDLEKGYEFTHNGFRIIKDQYLSNSKIKMTLMSPTTKDTYNTSVKVYGKYNRGGYSFTIGEATLPIKVKNPGEYNLELKLPLKEVSAFGIDFNVDTDYPNFELIDENLNTIEQYQTIPNKTYCCYKFLLSSSYRIGIRGYIPNQATGPITWFNFTTKSYFSIGGLEKPISPPRDLF